VEQEKGQAEDKEGGKAIAKVATCLLQ